jgi:hypothetical protein
MVVVRVVLVVLVGAVLVEAVLVPVLVRPSRLTVVFFFWPRLQPPKRSVEQSAPHLVVMMFSRAQILCCFLNLIRTPQRASAFAASTGAHRRFRRSRLHQKRHPKHSSGMSDRTRRRRRYSFAQCPPAAAPTAAVLHHVPVLRGLAVDRGL